MVADLKILGIPGSLRKASFNRSALVAAQSLLPAGASLDVFELEGIPVYNQDLDKQPPARVVELKARVRAADAILFATPEYNYSIPGVLKNAIDWASRPYGDSAWQGKPVAVMGASVGILGQRTGPVPPAPVLRVPEHVSGQPAGGTDRQRGAALQRARRADRRDIARADPQAARGAGGLDEEAQSLNHPSPCPLP